MLDSINLLRPSPPDNPLTANTPTLPDALVNTYQTARDWLERQRQASYDQGLADPATGLPTAKGLLSAAQQYGQGMLLGTKAPGLRAFHGSPADFNRFDIGKMGTGEGNQAFGKGLYFAESEGTAKTYRDKLTKGDAAKTGRMYEVDLNVDPERMYNYDQDFKDQTPKVQKIISKVAKGEGISNLEVEAPYMLHDPDIVAKLRDEGLHGISYLDQQSRATGEGTRNHVVFDDKNIDILRKYGIAGLIGGGGAAAAGANQGEGNADAL